MLKISNLNKTHEHGQHYSEEQKIAAVTAYLAVGNMRIVAGATGIAYGLLRIWKSRPWWKEYEYEIKNAKRSETKDKLSKIVDKSLVMIEDRLENGDLVLNNKTGELIRKPVALRDISKLANDMLERQEKLDKQKLDESAIQTQETMADTLKLLAEEFAKFNGSKKKEILDVTDVTEVQENALHEEWETGLQTGVSEVPGDSGTETQPSGAECSSERTLQGGLSPQGGW